MEIILQVAYALCHLHGHKIIHRDLKPENILITESGEIKVIDFGIAQLKNETFSEKTKINQIIGTPIYMSPEQKIDPANVSFQTDIYSLGIITYELVLGKLSHGSINLTLLPEKLQKIISKSLNADLSKRYQNAVDFITDVSEYIKNLKDSDLKEDEKVEELISSFDQANQLLFPKQFDKSSKINIIASEKKGKAHSGAYLDYFQLSDDRHLVIFAEPVKDGIKTINYTSILRGMVQAVVLQFFSRENKTDHLSSLLLFLNSIVINDSAKQHFAFSALLLSLDKNQLCFASLGHEFLLIGNEETKKITAISSLNPFLGIKLDTISETSFTFQKNDRLILCSLEANSNFKKQNHAHLKKVISDNIIFPVRMMNDAILDVLQKEHLKATRQDKLPGSKVGQSKIDPSRIGNARKRRSILITVERRK